MAQAPPQPPPPPGGDTAPLSCSASPCPPTARQKTALRESATVMEHELHNVRYLTAPAGADAKQNYRKTAMQHYAMQ